MAIENSKPDRPEIGATYYPARPKQPFRRVDHIRQASKFTFEVYYSKLRKDGEVQAKGMCFLSDWKNWAGGKVDETTTE